MVLELLLPCILFLKEDRRLLTKSRLWFRQHLPEVDFHTKSILLEPIEVKLLYALCEVNSFKMCLPGVDNVLFDSQNKTRTPNQTPGDKHNREKKRRTTTKKETRDEQSRDGVTCTPFHTKPDEIPRNCLLLCRRVSSTCSCEESRAKMLLQYFL